MERDRDEGTPPAGAASWSFRTPLILAAALICLITGWNLVRQVPARSPRTPWESIEVVESWRSYRGLPVYELGPDGHATHFYGALAPWFQGELFRWFGPSNVAGRVLTLVSALGAVTLIAASTRTGGSGWSLIIAWAALVGVNHRSYQYYSENRPDMTALFLGSAAIVMLYRGMERSRASWTTLGTACLILSFFFKQTTLVYAVVPGVVLALRGRRPSRRDVVLALVPLAAAVGAIVWLKVACPAIYHYMIEVPGSYRVDRGRAVNNLRVFLLDSPLFLILVGEWLAAQGGSPRKDARMTWVLAVLVVALPAGAMAQAKIGGTDNSMLPPLLGMLAFCGLRLPHAMAWLERRGDSNRTRVLLGSFAAAMLLLTIFPRYHLIAGRPPWEATYDDAVAAASRLPGKVVCPEDPTIPMFAKSYAGRGLYSELDANAVNGEWPREMPRGVVDDLRTADYVVEVPGYGNGKMDHRVLEGLGFVPDAGIGTSLGPYRFWRRAEAPGTTGPRTAWTGERSDRPPARGME